MMDNCTQQFLELHDMYQNAKREVERLEHILNCYALQYGTVTEQQEVIDKAKAEVARKIFEEIERFLYLHFRFCKEEIGNDDTEYVKGRLELNTQIQNFIAELKKKYIGEQE